MAIKYVRGVFFRGLVALLPIAVTVLIAVWLISGFESLFRPFVQKLVSDAYYIPGMSVVVGFLVVFCVGLVLQAILAQKVWRLGEQLLARMPLLSHVFQALKRIISYMSGAELPQGGAVVLVDLGYQNARALGLITAEQLDFYAGSEHVAVFLPWSYQLGGKTLIVHRDAVEPVDMTPQEALRFSLTAGISSGGAPRRTDADT